MQKSLLIQIIKVLNKRELSRFVKYVYSPFFNKHEKLQHLIDLVESAYPDFDSNMLTKEKVFKFLYPKEKFNSRKINVLISELLKLLEGYLTQLQFEKQPILSKTMLLTELLDRDLEQYFQRLLNKTENLLAKNPYKDTKYLYNNYLIAEKADLFYASKNKRSKDETLQRKVNQLDLFYLANKLRNCCEMVNRQNVIDTKYDTTLLEELLLHIQKNIDEYKDYPAITIYYEILMTLTHADEEEYYQQLIALLRENVGQFSKDETNEMYRYAQNYCIKKINQGKDNYLNELFALFKDLLAQDLLIRDGFLLEWDYKNFVTVGLRLQEFDWTIQFIEEYKDKLKKEVIENAYAYNLACLYYAQQKYGEAMQILLGVNFTDVVYHLGVKSLLLKIYYETNETEPLYSLFDTFRIYLVRNKVMSDYQKKIYKNFIKFTKKAYQFKIEKDFLTGEMALKQRCKLQKNISVNPEIANRTWLMERIEDL